MLPIPGFISPRVIDRGQILAIMMPSGQINLYQLNMNQYNYASLMHIFFLTVLGFQPNHEIWEKVVEEAVVRNYAEDSPVLCHGVHTSWSQALPARCTCNVCGVVTRVCGGCRCPLLYSACFSDIESLIEPGAHHFSPRQANQEAPVREPSVSTPSSQPWEMRPQSALGFVVVVVLNSASGDQNSGHPPYLKSKQEGLCATSSPPLPRPC